MVKIITYGTFDMLHLGHIRLLERAKILGDYLIVGVTSDSYDKSRGKINNQQTLLERIAAVKATGIADEIIIEEYEGQKIDDIRRLEIDIFTVGSDWKGYFDYLREYCNVIYLPRTEGISSTEIRCQKRSLRLGMIGETPFLNKIIKEAELVNGINVVALYSNDLSFMEESLGKNIELLTKDYSEFISSVDAVYIRSLPEFHYSQIKQALENGKHVLCESPVTLDRRQCEELFELATNKNLILMEALKTAYSTAYSRLISLVKTGKIGEIISVDSTCTSLRDKDDKNEWCSMLNWGPTALLPVLQIFGTEFVECKISSKFRDNGYDSFSKIDISYEHSVATVKVGDGFKSEGDLIISGSKGYVYVPAPWWKTEYFEIRYEDISNNRRYYYHLDGEGIRYELVAFARAIEQGWYFSDIEKQVTFKIAEIMEKFTCRQDITIIYL